MHYLNLIQSFNTRYRTWQEQRFLKRHDCKTWREYHRKFDPDYNIRATLIKDVYHGYPYVYCFENGKHFAYEHLADYGPGGIRWGYHNINDWCSENLGSKFRLDWHRVDTQTGIGLNLECSKEWVINEISGGDYIFAAFKDEQDYVFFLLRWS